MLNESKYENILIHSNKLDWNYVSLTHENYNSNKKNQQLDIMGYNELIENDWTKNLDVCFFKEKFRICDEICEKEQYSFSSIICNSSRKIKWGNNKEKIEKKATIRISANKGKKDHIFYDIPILNNTKLNSIVFDDAFNYIVKNFIYEKKEYINGKMNVIFSPRASGYFIHEIIGHPLEGDLENKHKNDFFLLGSHIMPDFINIDEAPSELKNIGYDFGKYDDDCNELKNISIIRNGMVINHINYKRCINYNYPLLNRMHNLVLRPNPQGDNIDKMIEKTITGIVVDEIIYGVYNIYNNSFLLYCGRTRIIKNGKICGYTDGVIVQDEINMLKNKIVEIGNDFNVSFGECIKQTQAITVGMGAPSMLLEDMYVYNGELSF